MGKRNNSYAYSGNFFTRCTWIFGGRTGWLEQDNKKFGKLASRDKIRVMSSGIRKNELKIVFFIFPYKDFRDENPPIGEVSSEWIFEELKYLCYWSLVSIVLKNLLFACLVQHLLAMFFIKAWLNLLEETVIALVASWFLGRASIGDFCGLCWCKLRFVTMLLWNVYENAQWLNLPSNQVYSPF